MQLCPLDKSFKKEKKYYSGHEGQTSMTMARDPQPPLTMETHDCRSLALDTHDRGSLQTHGHGYAVVSRPTFVGLLRPTHSCGCGFLAM